MAEIAHLELESWAPEVPQESLALERLQRFTCIVEEVVRDRETAERLGCAGVAVRIVLSDLPSQPVTLELLAPAASVRRGFVEQRPDVQLRLSSAHLDDVLLKRSFLPLHVLSGEVEFVGCIRKFLRVLPILSAAAVKADERLGQRPVQAV